MNFSVRELHRNEDSILISFLDELGKNNPSVLGYHYPLYRDMLENCSVGKSISLGCFANEILVGFLPLVMKESEGECTFSSMPFFGPNAGVVCDYESLDCEKIHEQLLRASLVCAQEKNAVSVSYYTPFHNNSTQKYYAQYLTDSYVVEKNTTFIELETYEPDSSLRYDLRKAENAGVKIIAARNEDDILAMNSIYQKNCSDYGIPPKPLDCLRFLINQSAENGSTTTWLATIDDKIVAGLVMIFSPSTASYYLPCSVHEYRTQQPSTLLIHHAMLEAKRRGIEYWNWESSPSKESGVYKFKKKWGSLDGHYKIFVKPLRDVSYFRSQGVDGISKRFPYYFVFPFNQLVEA